MEARGIRKQMVGVVTSNKMDKTVVVNVTEHVRHPLYKKYIKLSYRQNAHAETNSCGERDTVRVMETRPISKDKRWRVVEIVTRAE